MKEFLASDGKTFKVRVCVNNCKVPQDLMHLKFIGEGYDNAGNKTDESSYDFFLTAEQIRALGENLKDAVA